MSNNVYVYLQSKLTSPNMTKDAHMSVTQKEWMNNRRVLNHIKTLTELHTFHCNTPQCY